MLLGGKVLQEEETKQREETVAELVFTLLDSDADGRITAQDLTWVCTQLGLDTTPAEPRARRSVS